MSHFLATMGERDVAPRAITPEAVEALTALDWPGNVRELRNTIERLIILSSGRASRSPNVDRLAGPRPADDGSGLGSLAACTTFEAFKAQAERAFLLSKLRTFDWNVSETARALECRAPTCTRRSNAMASRAKTDRRPPQPAPSPAASRAARAGARPTPRDRFRSETSLPATGWRPPARPRLAM